MLGPHHCVCCRPFHFFVCVRLGAPCVSLSLVPQQHQTTCTTTNKCYNKIIWKKNIFKTRRPINNNICIYYVYMCVYIPLYMSYISSMRPTERPTDRPTARPPVWTDRSARPPVSPVPKTNQTKPTMCNVRSIKPLYLWMIPKAPNGKPQQNLYHFFSCISFLPKNTNKIPNISYRYKTLFKQKTKIELPKKNTQ